MILFYIGVHSPAYVFIIYENTNSEFPWEHYMTCIEGGEAYKQGPGETLGMLLMAPDPSWSDLPPKWWQI